MYVQGLNFSTFIIIFFYKNKVFTVTFQTAKKIIQKEQIFAEKLGYNLFAPEVRPEVKFILIDSTLMRMQSTVVIFRGKCCDAKSRHKSSASSYLNFRKLSLSVVFSCCR